MTGFFVRPADVTALGELIKGCGGAGTTLASRLTGDPGDWGEGGGLMILGGIGVPLLLRPAREAINELQRIGVQNTERAGALGTASGEALGTVAEHYNAQDEHTRELFDKRYKENCAPKPLEEGAVVRTDPTRRFKPVADPLDDPRFGEETPGMEHPGGVLWEKNWGVEAFREASAIIEKASVSAYVREVATRICGTDPFNALVTLIGGLGYELLGNQAIAFRDAGYGFGAIKKNIDQGRYEIQESWTGHVADEARAWLQTYSDCCGQHSTFLQRAGEKLMNLARLLYLAFESINRALDMLIDELLHANLVTDIIVGVRNLVRGENPLHIAAAVLANAQHLSDAIDAAHTAVQGFQALGEVLAATEPVQPGQWPPEPYKLPKGL